MNAEDIEDVLQDDSLDFIGSDTCYSDSGYLYTIKLFCPMSKDEHVKLVICRKDYSMRSSHMFRNLDDAIQYMNKFHKNHKGGE